MIQLKNDKHETYLRMDQDIIFMFLFKSKVLFLSNLHLLGYTYPVKL